MAKKQIKPTRKPPFTEITLLPEHPSNSYLLKPGVVCRTEPKMKVSRDGQPIPELALDATEGFIPLWKKNTTLRWRFRESSFEHFSNPSAKKDKIRKLFSDTLSAWGDAAPVTFKETNRLWHFEMVMLRDNECDDEGCVLASAFFPDSFRQSINLYPEMFLQSKKDQIETLVHELGHIFGLRHYFALESEASWPAEIFGTHSKFSIMNYGGLSMLTKADRKDLIHLYEQVWSGKLKKISGTPIKLVKPY